MQRILELYFPFLSFENRSNILSPLNFIKFKRHLSTLLLSFTFKCLYLNTLWNDSQNMFVLIPSPTREAKLYCFRVSKNSGNNSQTTRFLFVMLVYVAFLQASSKSSGSVCSRAIPKYL